MSSIQRDDKLWGLDLGGTKIEGVVLKSAREPEVLFRTRVPTGAEQGYEHVLSQIQQLVRHMEASVGSPAPSLGLATPGTLEPRTGLLKNSNATCLNGQPLKAAWKSASVSAWRWPTMPTASPWPKRAWAWCSSSFQRPG